MSARFPIDGSRDALWRATAVPAPAAGPLDGSVDCDVAIVGGGLTGSSAALELAGAGASAVVLEAESIGFGASGRAGGQVNLGLNSGPAALLDRFGEARGRRLIELVLDTPRDVFALIDEHGLDCDAVRAGWVQAAANESIRRDQLALAEDCNRHCRESGRAEAFEPLDADALARASGAHGYAGGLLCPSAGSVQPLSYTRELARVAIARGARFHGRSAVDGVARDGDRWRLSTARGEVRARTVLVCTNGYTRARRERPLKGLDRTVVPIRSVLAATEPLPRALRARILPGEVTFVDKRRLILYGRYDRDGRLCMGDHGPMRDAFARTDFDAVVRRSLAVFPELEGVAWDYRWGGRVAMTRSGLPFVHEIEPGLVAGMGFNGRGVGMGTIVGRELARFALGGGAEATAFPVTRPEAFALHRFHRAGASMAVRWYALQDHLDRYR